MSAERLRNLAKIPGMLDLIGPMGAEVLNDIADSYSDMYKVLEFIADPDHLPEYHHQAMGCGLEDRDITDRYDAMNYGWNKAIDAMKELFDYAEIESIIAKAKGE